MDDGSRESEDVSLGPSLWDSKTESSGKPWQITFSGSGACHVKGNEEDSGKGKVDVEPGEGGPGGRDQDAQKLTCWRNEGSGTR